MDPFYEPLDPAVVADPYPYFDRLRRHRPVYWHAGLDSWLVTSHGPAREVLADVRTFASDFRRAGIDTPPAQLSIQSLDPPGHTDVRHVLVAALQRHSPRALASGIRQTVAGALDALAGGTGPAELVGSLARPLALRTICAYLDVRPPGGADFERWSNGIVRSMDAGIDPTRIPAGTEGRRELSRLVDDWLVRAPEGTFMGTVRTLAAGAGADERAVLVNSLRAVLHAGYESMSRFVGNVLVRLVRDPDVLPALTTGRLDAVVEDLARLDGPVHADARVCVEDRLLDGTPVRRGDVVVLLLGAANRDPAAFASPHALLPTRTAARHLAFGAGAHACLGKSLATTLVRAILDGLIGRRVTFGAGEVEFEPTATLRGPHRITATVTAAAPVPGA